MRVVRLCTLLWSLVLGSALAQENLPPSPLHPLPPAFATHGPGAVGIRNPALSVLSTPPRLVFELSSEASVPLEVRLSVAIYDATGQQRGTLQRSVTLGAGASQPQSLPLEGLSAGEYALVLTAQPVGGQAYGLRLNVRL
ncbi:hypothetical protein HNR42_003512 [Deinobacterium chartae]|uniref:Uncharacterized protein n=1 Tax=Deinobacterium chartae TaxID=521158 RepID=A0A841I2Z7_9DEIO|nr:hypothetical protein [Deinobacterium chartae]MBB6100047.1 hypothetical protein [Deinobacterium chartae]